MSDILEAHELNDEHEDLYDKFFEGKSYEGTSEGTRRTGLRDWLSWLESEDTDVEEAKQSHLKRYIDDRKELADQSIVARFNAISIFYIFLSDRGHIDAHNPAEGMDLDDWNDINPTQTKQVEVIVRQSRSSDSKKQILSLKPPEVEAILNHVPNPQIRNECAMRLMYECGLRAKEVESLKYEDVDRENRHLVVDSAKINDPSEELYYRDQWWSPDSRLDYLMYRWEEEERPQSKHSDSDNYFITSHSGRLQASYIGRKVTEAAKASGHNSEPLYIDAGGEPRWLVSGHSLRISYITHMCNRTPVPIPMIAELAGHKKIQTTYDYVHTDSAELESNQKEYAPK